MRTLVIHTGGIGDFLLALPAIAILPRPISLAGDRDRLDLAVAGGIAEAAHSLDALDFQSVLAEPSNRLRTFVSGFGCAVVWMRDPDGAIRRGLHACGVERIETFPGLPDAAGSRHATEYYADCLKVTTDAEFHLEITPKGPPLDIVIHPGSGSVKKNWPIENFSLLGARLRSIHRQVTWCIGPAEASRAQTVDLVGDTLRCDSLIELAVRLATARLYIGNDSGITHLAASLGIPTIAIFGPTNPKIWAPRGERVNVVRGTPWPSPEQVLSMIDIFV